MRRKDLHEDVAYALGEVNEFNENVDFYSHGSVNARHENPAINEAKKLISEIRHGSTPAVASQIDRLEELIESQAVKARTKRKIRRY